MIRSCVVLCIYGSALLDGVLHHFMNAREHSMLISASPTRSSNPLIILAGGSYEEASSVARSLREIGYSCVCSPDYRTFEQHARLVKPDLLLLDSDIHGEFLRDGKRWEEFQSVPMIHLVSSAAERENAFAAGAVDCVVKPVLTEELLARVKGRLDLQQAQKQLDQRNMQFATTLENIGQGVCFFDADQRLILSNRRYAEVYGLPPEMIKPGMTLSEITELRYAVGACPVVPHDEYLAWCDAINSKSSPQDWSMELKSGKVIRVHHERTSDGGWVSTHEDITEHRNAERQIARLALHDPLTDLPNRAALKQKLDTLLEQHQKQGTSLRSCASTSTASRRSMTSSVTMSGIKFCAWLPNAFAQLRWVHSSRAWVATNSWSWQKLTRATRHSLPT